MSRPAGLRDDQRALRLVMGICPVPAQVACPEVSVSDVLAGET